MKMKGGGLSNFSCPCQWIFIVYYVLVSVNIFLTSVSCGVELHSFSYPSDSCAAYDTCNVSDFFRTCSCDEDCSRYGICCFDAPVHAKESSNKESFYCYGERLPQPVFFKRMCSSKYKGNRDIKSSCEDPSTKMADLVKSVPVSSKKTGTTYWNWNCGICNEEKIQDLFFWTVQASCPIGTSHKRFDVDVYRENMAYQDSTDSWGIYDSGKFRKCEINFFEPASLMGRLKYCAQEIVSECPADWDDAEVRNKCQMFHAERKNKVSSVYYKNVFCAVCNGVSLRELECFGRNYRAYHPVGDMKTMRIVFNLNPSVGEHTRGHPSCSPNKRYDPFLKLCRSVNCGIVDADEEGRDACVPSSSAAVVSSVMSLVIAVFVSRTL